MCFSFSSLHYFVISEFVYVRVLGALFLAPEISNPKIEIIVSPITTLIVLGMANPRQDLVDEMFSGEFSKSIRLRQSLF